MAGAETVFAGVDDVTARILGAVPSAHVAYIEGRIADVEAALLGRLPSLATDTDPIRRRRATTAVIDKVLALYETAKRQGLISRTADAFSETYSPAGITRSAEFTDAELKPLRRRKPSPVGQFRLRPWGVP